MSTTSEDISFTVSSNCGIRDTAKKYKYARWTQQEHQFSVDTAAIASAFPDFTQGSASEKEITQDGLATVEDDISIEIGRGHPIFDQSIRSPSLPKIKFNSINTADMLRQRVLTKTTTNENMPPSSSPYVSNASRTTSGERKQLAELRAQVQSDTENSTMGTEKTNTITFPTRRSSRFSHNKSESQQIPANISARFTSPAKSVAKTIAAQPTQSSFIIQANVDTTGRDTEELGVPLVVEHGEIQQRKASSRRFRRVSGIRTPEEEKELWLLAEKLKAENAALKTRADYQQHVNNTMHERNEKVLREMDDFKMRMSTEFEVKITEMTRRLDEITAENALLKNNNAAIVAETALKNKETTRARDISKLEAEMARLRTEVQTANGQGKNARTSTEETYTGHQFGSTRQTQTQKETTHTYQSDSRVEFQGTHTFELPNLKVQKPADQTLKSDIRVETQRTDTDGPFDISSRHIHRSPTRTVREASRTKVHDDDEDNVTQLSVVKLRTRKASAKMFKPKFAIEEATLRPATDPQQALAIVMAQLKEEYDELADRYTHVTAQYAALDPAKNKRMRQELMDETERLRSKMERKAGQVYLLHDVHEGIQPYDDDQE